MVFPAEALGKRRMSRAAVVLGFLILLSGLTTEVARSATCITATPLFQLRS